MSEEKKIKLEAQLQAVKSFQHMFEVTLEINKRDIGDAGRIFAYEHILDFLALAESDINRGILLGDQAPPQGEEA